jgi:tRNA-2-methylthio-N6-dimethylallyladenosine synthase
MNKLDSELVLSALTARGYRACDSPDEAGLILFITCSVREHAEERVHSRLGALKRLKRERPDIVVGILGCMAQEHAEGLFRKHSHLDIVCGTRDFHAIADLVERVRSGESKVVAVESSAPPSVDRNERLRPASFRAFLSVMRGCDRYCSYCIVPFVRGREESRSAESIVEEAKRLVGDGVVEITLLGQTVNNYRDGEGVRLSDLLRRLDTLPGLERLHFVTSFPSYVDDDLINAVAECRTVTRFLHIPVQSGSDRILKGMNRRYTADSYRRMVAKFREAVPDVEFGSDFIVGFPGESDEDFQATLVLMEEIRFQQSFVFRYSPRPGTVAARRFEDDVPLAVKRERNTLLLEAQDRIGLEKNSLLLGRDVEVLVEGKSRRDKRRYTGRTRQNNIVAFPCDEEGLIGRLVRVRVAGNTALTLIGDLLEEDTR